MRSVLESIPEADPLRERAYCLLSYDSPTREEVSRVVSAGDKVILCTDVISSGTLIDEIAALVKREGGTVLAVIGLVDAQFHKQDSWQSMKALGADQVPMFFASALPRKHKRTLKDLNGAFWADPVSAVPTAFRTDRAIDGSKIFRSIRTITNLQALSVGHFVSGLRHTSIDVDLRRLLEQQEMIAGMLDRELDFLGRMEWDGYYPTIALVPTGLIRLDPIASTHLDNASTFARIVAETCDFSFETISVPRTFDTGGQARCADISYILASKDISDVLIIDDGITTGTTVRSLVNQSVQFGARRIVVLALIARASSDDLELWETARYVEDKSSEHQALVKLAYPFYLPVPYHTETECPQCTTLRSLQKREAVSKAAGFEGLVRELREDTILDRGSVFANAWLDTLVRSELAANSPKSYAELNANLNKLKQDGNIDTPVREAVIRLYLTEWRLLYRSRLRHETRRIVFDLAMRQLTLNRSQTTFIEALSLIRSLFRDRYLDTVTRFISDIVPSEGIVDRVEIHLRTLTEPTNANRKNRVIENIIEHLDTVPNTAPRIGRQRAAFDSLLKATSSIERYFPSQLEAILESLRGKMIVHDVFGPLREASNMSPEWSTQQRREFYNLVAQNLEVMAGRLAEEFYPLIYGISEPLSLSKRMMQGGERYLHDYLDAESENLNLISDLTATLQGFQIFADQGIEGQMLGSSIDGINRLIENVFGTNSLLKRTLHSFIPYTVKELSEKIATYFRSFEYECEISVIESHIVIGPSLDALRVVLPDTHLSQFLSLTANNLTKHALLEGGRRDEIKLCLNVSYEERSGRSHVGLRLANTGKPRTNPVGPRARSRAFDRELRKIGGSFQPSVDAIPGYSSAALFTLATVSGLNDAYSDR